MNNNKDILLGKLRDGSDISTGEQFKLTMLLAFPAILAQLSICLMTYIDTAMVGQLGSGQAASIGLVSSSAWILGGFCYSNARGFSVQIAHKCGAKKFGEAHFLFSKGFLCVTLLGILLGLTGIILNSYIPNWLGGSEEINADASAYLLIYSAFIPILQITVFSEASLIASGNLRITSIVSFIMCALDVLFNWVFIYGMDMGVKGAALGTGMAETFSGLFLILYATRRSPELKQDNWLRNLTSTRDRIAAGAGKEAYLKKALDISWPLWIQNIVTRGAYIAATVIIAPLGTIAIAANSFAITAEGFCYLPGSGMQDAATTLVGQSLGAGRKKLAKRFSWLTIGTGSAMMGILAVFMWIFAAPIMGLLTPDPDVIELGAQCLRIEAWAEVLFGVSIVGYGCCIGAGDTLMPSAINLFSMWLIRIGLALVLIPKFGLSGYWMAMAAELSAKGIIFAFRIKGRHWLKKW